MFEHQDELHVLFEKMLKKGYISSSNTWLETAIQQKNSRLPLSIANSKLLHYDNLDISLLNITWKN